MKITIIKTGYYAPSKTNWCYGVHMIIDSTGARLYSEKFGGDSRVKRQLEEKGFKVEVLHAGVGSLAKYSYADIKRLHDIEAYPECPKNWGEKNIDDHMSFVKSIY